MNCPHSRNYSNEKRCADKGNETSDERLQKGSLSLWQKIRYPVLQSKIKELRAALLLKLSAGLLRFSFRFSRCVSSRSSPSLPFLPSFPTDSSPTTQRPVVDVVQKGTAVPRDVTKSQTARKRIITAISFSTGNGRRRC